MNTPGTITPEQLEELDTVRNEIFYLYMDVIDVRKELAHEDLRQRLAEMYNRAGLLFAAISHRAVVTIDIPQDVVVKQEQTTTDTTGTYCRECMADIETAHFRHCKFTQ